MDEGLGDEVRITVIATGFRAGEEKRAVARSVPAMATAPARALPPPIPLEVRAKEPQAAARPAEPVPVVVRKPRAPLKPAETEDQYDIPAFLRRGSNAPRE